MKIVDARAGQAVIDRDGDVWVRTMWGATMVADSSSYGERRAVVWSEDDLPDADANFGPFTLVEGCEDA